MIAAHETADGLRPVWLFRVTSAAYLGAAIVLLLTMVVIAANALLRYFFHGGSSAVYDVARFSFPLIIFLGLTQTNAEGGHARVGLLLAVLPRAASAVLGAYVVPVLSLLYILALFVSSVTMTWLYAQSGSRTSGVLAIPLAPVTAVLAATTALFLVAQIIRLLHGTDDRHADHDKVVQNVADLETF